MILRYIEIPNKEIIMPTCGEKNILVYIIYINRILYLDNWGIYEGEAMKHLVLVILISCLLAVRGLGAIGSFNEDSQTDYPNKEIIQTFSEDMNNDSISEDISLIMNNANQELIIAVNDNEQVIKSNVNREQIFGQVLSDQYKYDFIVKGNKILVALLYTGTQKYGSSADVYCYEYTDNKIEKIWSSQDYEDKSLLITEIDLSNNNIKIDMFGQIKDRILRDRDIEYLQYREKECDLLKESVLASVIIPNYGLKYGSNGEIQLVIRLVIWSGAGPISDSYIMKFKYTEEGIQLQDSWFESTEPQKSELITYKEW